jgi:hypothetical protein
VHAGVCGGGGELLVARLGWRARRRGSSRPRRRCAGHGPRRQTVRASAWKQAGAVARVRGAGARQQEVNAARVERSERVSCDAARVARGASVRARSRAAERRGASALGERGATRPKQERSSASGAATAQASGMERADACAREACATACAGARSAGRWRACGGVRELVERDVAARAGARGTQRTGVQALGGRRTGGASNAGTRVRARE